jgi:hypothetical protein
MMINAIDGSQRRAGRVAGLAYLTTFATVVYVNFGIYNRLIVHNDIAETARNILAHERFFRLGITGDLFYCAGVVVLLTALYIILEPVNRALAAVAAFWRLIWVVMWLRMTLNLLDALRLIRSSHDLGALEPARSQALASLSIDQCFDYYYVGLLFGALASTVCGYLWLKSRYVPRGLAVFGVGASAFCVGCTFIFFIFPGFDKIVNLWWFDTRWGFSILH